MWSRRSAILLALAGLLITAAAHAGDEEGCLICHRLEMRKSSAEGGAGLRVSEISGGPHDGLYCSDCHPDARTAPHTSSPGLAECIGECHSASTKARESHRAASFGGLTEIHRKTSAPRSPCILCHRAGDRPGEFESVVRRCGECHTKERISASRDVHARIGADGGKGVCVVCHVAHPDSANKEHAIGGEAVCSGKGCHTAVSPTMKRLAGHGSGIEGGKAPGRGAKTAVFLAIVAIGVLSGRGIGGQNRRGSRK